MNASNSAITEELYDQILEKWLEKPSVSHVVYELKLSRSLVRGVMTNGVPELGLEPLPTPKKKPRRSRVNGKAKTSSKKKPKRDPEMSLAARAVVAHEDAQQKAAVIKEQIRELESEGVELAESARLKEAEQELDGTVDALVIAERRAKREERRISNVSERAIAADNTRRAAQEAAASRLALDASLDLGAAVGLTAERLLEAVMDNKLKFEKSVTMKDILTLTTALDKLTAAMERALKIGKGRAGDPEKILGVRIGVMLDGCTDEELDQLLETGVLPARLRMIDAGVDD
jgi:hypothetical protein